MKISITTHKDKLTEPTTDRKNLGESTKTPNRSRPIMQKTVLISHLLEEPAMFEFVDAARGL